MRRAPTTTMAIAVAGVFAVSYWANAQLGGADGVRIPYQGVLERDGEGVTGTVALTFRLYTEPVGGSACYTSPALDTDVVGGRFSVVIGPVPEGCVVDKAVHLETSVDGGSGEVALAGRQRVYPSVGAYTSGSGDFRSNGFTLSQGARLRGDNETGNFHIDANSEGAAGADGHLYLNYFSGKGVHFGNGASGVVATMTPAGDLSARSVTTSNGFTGSLDGDVNGNVTGDVTGDVNGVNVFVKNGNNGTKNCDEYCFNAGFEGRAGACLGIRLENGQYSADCGYVPGLGTDLSCLCASW